MLKLKNSIQKLIGIVILTWIVVTSYSFSVNAAAGINKQINFQGRVVKSDGTNVANGTYSFVFGLYSVSSGGVAIWTETQSLTVTDGVFQAQLGSVNSLPGSVDFNTDNIYLGINFNSDGEMTPRVRFTAVPYAFNADKVGGITGTSNSDGFQFAGGTTSRALTVTGADITIGSTIKPTNNGGLSINTTGNASGLTLNTAAGSSGNSGDITIQTGNTSTSGSSGNISLDVGAAASTVNNGTITIGGTNANSINIGRSGKTASVLGALSVAEGLSAASLSLGTGTITGAGLSSCNVSSSKLLWNSSTNKFECGTDQTGGGTPAWDTIASPTSGNTSLSMGAYTTTFTWGAATGAGVNMFTLKDTASNTGTGYLLSLATQTGSAASPLRITAKGAEAFMIDNSGKVGVGTTSPSSLFSVGSSSQFQVDTSGNVTSSGTTGITLSGNGAKVAFTATANNPAQITTANNNHLALMPNGTGNVGVGTTTPGTKFDVVGNIQNLINASAAPTTLANDRNANNPQGIFVQGKYAYVADSCSSCSAANHGALRIYDISKPASSLSTVGIYDTGSNTTKPYSVYVAGNYAYLTRSGDNKLDVVDVSKPSTPTVLASVATGTAPYRVIVVGKYAYVLNNGSNSLQAFDVSNPSSPTLISTASISNATGPREMYIQGSYAYIVGYTANKIEIFNIANPASMTSTASRLLVGQQPTGVYVQGKYAYVTTNFTSNSYLEIYDISNPASIPAATSTTSNGTERLANVVVSGRYAFVFSDGGANGQMFIYDVQNPASPALVGTNPDPRDPASVFLYGRYLFTASPGYGQIDAYDIGGTETASVLAHSSELGSLSVDTNGSISNNFTVGGGLNVGTGGILSNGDLAVNSVNTTGNALSIVGNAITTGNGIYGTFNGLTTGSALSLASSSSVGGGSGSSYLINLSRSGVNASSAHSAYGLSSTVTNSGSLSTNIAGYFSATGATNNYAGIFANGNVGIGVTTPTSVLEVLGAVSLNATGSSNTSINASTSTGSVTIGNASTTAIKLGKFTTANGVLFVSATDGTVSETAAATGAQCLQTSGAGAAPTWGPCGSGGGGVTSVSNSDQTLTISPTTGLVVASLNLAHANTWTAAQTFSVAPVISTITNTGTLTLPTSTDTLVGRATIDILTNKTLTAPAINGTVTTTGLTLPAYTMGGDITGTSKNITNLTSISFGTTPASTGAVRLSASDSIRWRKNDNSGDVVGLFIDSTTNYVKFGTPLNMGNQAITEVYSIGSYGPANNDFKIDSGGGSGKLTWNGTAFVVSNAGTVTIASGQAYTGGGAVTLSSGLGSALTITGTAASIWSTAGSTADLTISSGSTTATALKITTSDFTSGSGDITLITGNASAGTAGDLVLDVGTSSTGNGSILIGTATNTKTITLGQTGATNADTIKIGAGTNANTIIYIGNGSTSSKVVFADKIAAPGAEMNTNGQVFFGNVGSVAASGRIWVRSSGRNYRFNSVSNVADYSEFIAQSEPSEQGDVMVVDSDHEETVHKSRGPYEENILGVVTNTGTGYNNGWCDDEVSCDRSNDPRWANVGMLGQVKVKVSTENGPIQVGDRLTTSSTPGVAMKATRAGQIIGRALVAYSNSDPHVVGRVLTLISPTYFDPGTAQNNSIQDLQLEAKNTIPYTAQIPYATAQQAEQGSNFNKFSIQGVVNSIGTFSQAIIANLKAGAILSKEVTSDTVVANKAAFSQVSAAQTTTDSLQVGTITSPNGSAVLGLTSNGQLQLKNAAGSTAIGFDSGGSAFFNGTITAKRISANQIDGLDTVSASVGSLQARVSNLETTLQNYLTPTLAGPTLTPANIAQLQGLTVNGSATVTGDLNVSGTTVLGGVLQVFDSLKTNHLLAKGLAEFWNTVTFKGNISFEGRPTFNSDTAGQAVVAAGQDRVDVQFGEAYAQLPVVNATLVFDLQLPDGAQKISDTQYKLLDGSIKTVDELNQEYEKTVLEQGISYIITRRTKNGFTIKLNKPATSPLQFSWIAMAVKDIKTSTNGSAATPPTLTPVTAATVTPTTSQLSPTTLPPVTSTPSPAPSLTQTPTTTPTPSVTVTSSPSPTP